MNDLAGDKLLAILGAVPFETDPLIDLLDQPRSITCADHTFHMGTYREWRVLVGPTGLGKVNAAITTAALLERLPLAEVWNVGCAGAFKGGPLGVGDVLVATSSICGDEGVLTREEVLPSTHIGIPIVTRDGREYYDRLPLDEQFIMLSMMEDIPEGWYRLAQRNRPAIPAGLRHDPRDDDTSAVFRLVYGPSLTVSMVSGDAEVAGERFRRYGPYAENMEGSAVAQACLRFDVPMVECRGISNMAGDRRKGEWQLEEAVSRCHGILLSRLGGYRSRLSPQ